MERRWSQAVRFFGTGLLLVFAWVHPEVNAQCCFVVNTPSKLLIYNAASAYLTVPQNTVVNSTVPLTQNGQPAWIPLDQKPWNDNRQAYYDSVSSQPSRNDEERRIYPVLTSGHNAPQQWTYSTPRTPTPIYLNPSSPPSSTPYPAPLHYPYAPTQFQPGPQYDVPSNQQTQNQRSQFQPILPNQNYGPDQGTYPSTSQYNAPNEQTSAPPPFIPIAPFVTNNPQERPPQPLPAYNQGNTNYNVPATGQHQTVIGEPFTGQPVIPNRGGNQPTTNLNEPTPLAQPPFNAPTPQNASGEAGSYNRPSSDYGQQNQYGQPSASSPLQYQPIVPQPPIPSSNVYNNQSSQYAYGHPGPQFNPPPSGLQNGSDIYHGASANYTGKAPAQPIANNSNQYEQPQIPNQHGNEPSSYNQGHSGYGLNEGQALVSSSTFQYTTSSPPAYEPTSPTTPFSGIQSQTIQYPLPTETPSPTPTESTTDLDDEYSSTVLPVSHPGYEGYPYENPSVSASQPPSTEPAPSIITSEWLTSPSPSASFPTTASVSESSPDGTTSQFDYPAPGGHAPTAHPEQQTASPRASDTVPQHDEPSSVQINNFLYPYSDESRHNPKTPLRDEPQGQTGTEGGQPVRENANSLRAVWSIIIVAVLSNLM